MLNNLSDVCYSYSIIVLGAAKPLRKQSIYTRLNSPLQTLKLCLTAGQHLKMPNDPAPCSFEALKAWRAEHPEGHESIYTFHTHNCFDPDDPREVQIGKDFDSKMSDTFAGKTARLPSKRARGGKNEGSSGETCGINE
jgi:hypothetical protein